MSRIQGLTLNQKIVRATKEALTSVDAARFFKTERGFHGRFYCALLNRLDQVGLPVDGAILEMEYQKSARHNTSQRPDIVLHVPAELSGLSVRENNFAVWALKRRASPAHARADFERLDEMFECLDYRLAFFVNIDSSDHMSHHYDGPNKSRLVAIAVLQENSRTKLVCT